MCVLFFVFTASYYVWALRVFIHNIGANLKPAGAERRQTE
jgi:hypothetical protein